MFVADANSMIPSSHIKTEDRFNLLESPINQYSKSVGQYIRNCTQSKVCMASESEHIHMAAVWVGGREGAGSNRAAPRTRSGCPTAPSLFSIPRIKQEFSKKFMENSSNLSSTDV